MVDSTPTNSITADIPVGGGGGVGNGGDMDDEENDDVEMNVVENALDVESHSSPAASSIGANMNTNTNTISSKSRNHSVQPLGIPSPTVDDEPLFLSSPQPSPSPSPPTAAKPISLPSSPLRENTPPPSTKTKMKRAQAPGSPNKEATGRLRAIEIEEEEEEEEAAVEFDTLDAGSPTEEWKKEKKKKKLTPVLILPSKPANWDPESYLPIEIVVQAARGDSLTKKSSQRSRRGVQAKVKEIEDISISVPPLKRGRGRPAKDSSTHTPAVSAPPILNDDVPKRGRGRPAKDSQAPVFSTPVPPMLSSTGPGTRKRATSISLSTPSRTGTPIDGITPNPKVTYGGKRRGRPPKKKAKLFLDGEDGDQQAAAGEDDVPNENGKGKGKEASNEGDEIQEIPPPGSVKRGRGRPKKSTEAVTTAQQSSLDSPIASGSGSGLVKRGPGRPRKSSIELDTPNKKRKLDHEAASEPEVEVLGKRKASVNARKFLEEVTGSAKRALKKKQEEGEGHGDGDDDEGVKQVKTVEDKRSSPPKSPLLRVKPASWRGREKEIDVDVTGINSPIRALTPPRPSGSSNLVASRFVPYNPAEASSSRSSSGRGRGRGRGRGGAPVYDSSSPFFNTLAAQGGYRVNVSVETPQESQERYNKTKVEKLRTKIFNDPSRKRPPPGSG